MKQVRIIAKLNHSIWKGVSTEEEYLDGIGYISLAHQPYCGIVKCNKWL